MLDGYILKRCPISVSGQAVKKALSRQRSCKFILDGYILKRGIMGVSGQAVVQSFLFQSTETGIIVYILIARSEYQSPLSLIRHLTPLPPLIHEASTLGH